MIIITPKEDQVLQAYKHSGTMKVTAELCELSRESVRVYMIRLEKHGLAKKLEQGKYEILDLPYTVMTFSEKMEEKQKTKHEIKVTMSEDEKKFMNEHYKTKYQKNRGEAARILGRTRTDICLMAIALNIHTKDGDYRVSSNNSKSA